MNFQEDLKKSILNADPKLDKKQLLEDIFKSFVSKMFEFVISKHGKNRIPFEAIVTIKKNLINEFRLTSLGEYQQSEEWYDNLFEKTVKEILEFASLAHDGIDEIKRANQNFEININAYKFEKGIYPKLAENPLL